MHASRPLLTALLPERDQTTEIASDSVSATAWLHIAILPVFKGALTSAGTLGSLVGTFAEHIPICAEPKASKPATKAERTKLYQLAKLSLFRCDCEAA